MKLKFPNLGALVNTDAKLNDDDARKYIHVFAGHAIVQNELICVVNLREYVKTECQITSPEDLEMLTGIIEYMEGKSFTADLWKEFTKEAFVSLIPGGFEIEYNTYNKKLFHDILNPTVETMIEVLKSNIGRVPATVDRISVSGKNMASLFKVFGPELKNDDLLFDFCGKEHAIKFSGRLKEYIFGIIPTNYNSATEITAFLRVMDFREDIQRVADELGV